MRRRLLHALVLAGVLAVACTASAQRFKFDHLTADSGLPSSFVYQIEQDKWGNIWFVTLDGLSRYDGREFTNFGAETGMSDQRLTMMARGPNGRLFIGHASGLSVWDGRVVRNYSEEDGLGRGTVWAIDLDPSGRAWIGTQAGGLSSLDGDRIRTFTTEDGLPSNYVYAVYTDSKGTLWIGTREDGFARAEICEDGSIDVFRKWSQADGLSSPIVHSFLEEPDGTMLVGTRGGGLWRVEEDDSLSRVAPQFADADIYSMQASKSGSSILLGLLGGGSQICGQPDYERCLVLNEESGLPTNAVTSMLQDREGSMWIGSTGGASRLAGHEFITYGRAEGLSSDFTLSIVPDKDGSLWISSLNGVTRLELGERMRSPVTTKTLTVADGLPSNEVWHSLRDSHGNLWFATAGGLCLYREERGCRTFGTREGLTSSLLLALFEDRDGFIWVGTRNGASRLRKAVRPDDGNITEFSGLEGFEIGTIEQAQDGSIWLSGTTTVARWAEGEWSVWKTGRELGVNTVTDTLATKDGAVWFSTNGEGLAMHDPDAEKAGTGILKLFGRESGLPSLAFKTLMESSDGMIWAASPAGLFKLDPSKAGSKEFVVRHYTIDDGLASQEPTVQHAFAETARGDLWFGFTGGVTRYIPAADPGEDAEPVVPLVVISSILAGQTRIYAAPFTTMMSSNGDPYDSVVAAPFGERSLSISYGAAVLKGRRFLEYQVLLDGYDDEWSMPSSRNSKDYTHLPPGNYTLRVRARIGNGPWSEETSLPLAVPAQAWESIWFRGLLVMVLLLILVSIHHLRTVSIRNKNFELAQLVAERTRSLEARTRELQETNIEFEHMNVELETVNHLVMEADRAKSRFLASMSHELRTPLNSIIGFTDLMIEGSRGMNEEKRGKFLTNVRTSATILLGLINDILDISKIEAGRMEVHIDLASINEIVEDVASTMRGAADPKGSRIIVDCDKELGEAHVDPIKVRQILQNLISNAIKYSDDGATVRVSSRRAEEEDAGIGREAFSLTVEDDGHGIPSDQLDGIFEEYRQAHEDSKRGMGTGLGLAIVRKFSELQGGRVAAESELGKGSTFQVWLPIDARHWDTERG